MPTNAVKSRVSRVFQSVRESILIRIDAKSSALSSPSGLPADDPPGGVCRTAPSAGLPP